MLFAEKVYEVSLSNGEIGRYADIQLLKRLDNGVFESINSRFPQDYYIATELTWDKNVIISERSKNVIWECMPPLNIDSYITQGEFIFFLKDRSEIIGFGFLGEKKVNLFSGGINTEVTRLGKKSISNGICVYGNIMISTRPLKIYRGIEEVVNFKEEEISKVRVSLKNINDMKVIEIEITDSLGKHALFVNEHGEELEMQMQLVPKKRE